MPERSGIRGFPISICLTGTNHRKRGRGRWRERSKCVQNIMHSSVWQSHSTASYRINYARQRQTSIRRWDIYIYARVFIVHPCRVTVRSCHQVKMDSVSGISNVVTNRKSISHNWNTTKSASTCSVMGFTLTEIVNTVPNNISSPYRYDSRHVVTVFVLYSYRLLFSERSLTQQKTYLYDNAEDFKMPL